MYVLGSVQNQGRTCTYLAAKRLRIDFNGCCIPILLTVNKKIGLGQGYPT